MTTRTHLDRLENQSVFIFREAYHAFKNIAMPWSMGKDSNVLIWLASKAFFGRVPFPVLHIDTTYEFPEMLEFREWATAHYKLNLIVKINEEARGRGVGYETHDPVTVTHELKTVALQQAMAQYKWDALITGIRRDEDPTRAKERYFSRRNAHGTTRISRRNSGDNSPPPRRTANTSACNRCWIGPRLIFGATSSVKIFRFRKCILPETASAIARSAAVQLPNTSRATQIPLRTSSLN